MKSDLSTSQDIIIRYKIAQNPVVKTGIAYVEQNTLVIICSWFFALKAFFSLFGKKLLSELHMRYFTLLFFYFFVFQTTSKGQDLMTPGEYLGYELGERFTYHHRVLDYFQYIGEHSTHTLLQKYGTTYEGRDLIVAYVSSPQNLQRLDSIRQQNKGMTTPGGTIPEVAIVWLSYNVHGNEANSTETAMKVLYELTSNANSTHKAWLDNLVIIIDPCLNPDGRDRYVNWYNQVGNSIPNPQINSREHHEGWASGRTNHYLFDLNRDWVWQTQIETEQRLKLYNSWLPQVHVDFHEQYYNDQYYFAPSAEPIHNLVSSWQMEFQRKVGVNNAKYFDEKGWLYFSGERFDLLYPGYGDSYPTFSGAIGMTYEMAGHSTAGLAIITEKGDTLQLSDRIDRHFATSMATIETCFENKSKLLREFQAYFTNQNTNTSSYLLKSTNADKLKQLAGLLDKNDILSYSPTGKTVLKGVRSVDNAQVSITTEVGDLLIPLNQPKGVLTRVLLEPRTQLTDSLTYDITAWSLPYVYGVESFLIQGKVPTQKFESVSPIENKPTGAYAWLLNWQSIIDAAFLSEALQMNLVTNYASEQFTLRNINFSRGSLIFTRIDNEHRVPDFETKLLALAKKHNRNLYPVMSGAEVNSFSLGSSKVKFMKNPAIALAWGEEVSGMSFGELWYFLEQEIHERPDVVSVKSLMSVMDDYDVILLPEGNYSSLQTEDGFNSLDAWIEKGGRLILLESAISGFTGEGKFSLKKMDEESDQTDSLPLMYNYEDNERESIKNYILGSIYKAKLDNTHPLAYGYEDFYYTLKLTTNGYKYLADGWNVGYIPADGQKVAGFSGAAATDKTSETLLFGVENRGRGSVVYFIDNPIFRGFWQNGKLLLANAIYFRE